jgi:hypothetical protein
MKIITEFVYPPIPIRWLDWVATYDDHDGAIDAGHHCTGYGTTEQESIDNLKDCCGEE